MKKLTLVSVLLCISVTCFGGEVRNSKLGKLIEESSQQHQDSLVAHTQKYTEKLGKLINEVIAMREEAEAMGLNPYMCYEVKDEDARISCSAAIMASVKGDESYCYQIQNKSDKDDCVASIKNDVGFCYFIEDKDTKNGCMAGIQQNISYCYEIKDQDAKFGCIAGVQQNMSYCYEIKNQDAKYGCLAGFPVSR